MALPTMPSAFAITYIPDWYTCIFTCTAGGTDHDGFRCYGGLPTSGIFEVFSAEKIYLISPNEIVQDDSFTFGDEASANQTFWICAYNSEGESAYRYVNLPGGATTTRPATPTALSVNFSSPYIRVNATAGDATHLGYQFQRYYSSAWTDTYNRITTDASIVNQVYVNGVAGDVDRPYRVRTQNYGGFSDWFTINEGVSSPPDQPTGFTITWTGSQIQYSATAAGATHTGYRVEKKTGATWTVVNTTVSTATSLSGIVLSGSEADSYKTYRLYTYNAIGDSVYLQVKNQSVISGLSVARNNASDLRKVTLSWTGIISDENTWQITHNDRLGYGTVYTLGSTTANTITVDLSIWFNFTLYVKASDGDSNTVSYAISSTYASVDFDEPISLSTLVADQSPTPNRVRLVYSVYGSWLKYVMDSGALTGDDEPTYSYLLTLSKDGETDVESSNALTFVDEDEYTVTIEVEAAVMGNDGWKGVWSITVDTPISDTFSTPLSNVVGDPILPNLVALTVTSIKEGEMVFNYTPVPWHKLNNIMLGWQWENRFFQSDIQIEASIDGEWRTMLDVAAYQYENNVSNLPVFVDAIFGDDPINQYVSEPSPGMLCRAFNGKYFDGKQNVAYTDLIRPTSGNTVPALCELFHDVQFRVHLVGSTDLIYSDTVEQIGLRSVVHPIMMREPGEFATFSPDVDQAFGVVASGYGGMVVVAVPINDYFDRQEYLISCDGDDFVPYQYLTHFYDEQTIYTHVPEGNVVGARDILLSGVYLRLLQEKHGITWDNWKTLFAAEKIKADLDYYHAISDHDPFFGYTFGTTAPSGLERDNPAQVIQRKYLDGGSHTLTHKIRTYDSNNTILEEFDFPSYSMVLPDINARTSVYEEKKHLIVTNDNHTIKLNFSTGDSFPNTRNDVEVEGTFIDGYLLDATPSVLARHAPYYSYKIANHNQAIHRKDDWEALTNETMDNSYDSLSFVSRKYDITTGQIDEVLTQYPSGGLSATYRSGILNHLLRSVPLTKPTTVHCGLMKSSGEQSGSNYSRVELPVDDATWERLSVYTSTIGNSNPVVFSLPSADWTNIIGFALFDGDSEVIVNGQFFKPVTVVAGRTNPVFSKRYLQVVVA